LKLKLIVVFSLLLTLGYCTLYNLATEEKTITDSDRPKSNEGIAVFRFVSDNKATLPSEIFFQIKEKNSIPKHFSLSSLFNTKDISRFIFLEKGIYYFKEIVYKFDGNIESFPFPANSFKIQPNRINYIGDITFYYSRRGTKLRVKDNMKRTMWDFYKKYPTLSVQYPLVKNILLIERPFKEFEK